MLSAAPRPRGLVGFRKGNRFTGVRTGVGRSVSGLHFGSERSGLSLFGRARKGSMIKKTGKASRFSGFYLMVKVCICAMCASECVHRHAT